MSAEVIKQSIEKPSDRVIVALDNMNWEQAGEVMEEVGPYVGIAKANSLAQKNGWKHAISQIANFGSSTMADTKFHDIPKTVELQVEQVSQCGAELMTIHTSGGIAMMEAAVEGRNKAVGENICGLIGITVLTSLDEEECIRIYNETPKNRVIDSAFMARDAGLDGIVCSGNELETIRINPAFSGLLTVVPGITPRWAAKAGDQKRVVTPTEAIQSGADFIVVGRAITQPPEGVSRAEAAQRIAEEVKEAL
jgi:orotidine-5'-phosphate decarboxylase